MGKGKRARGPETVACELEKLKECNMNVSQPMPSNHGSTVVGAECHTNSFLAGW